MNSHSTCKIIAMLSSCNRKCRKFSYVALTKLHMSSTEKNIYHNLTKRLRILFVDFWENLCKEHMLRNEGRYETT